MSFRPVKRSTFFRDVERIARDIAARNLSAANRFLDAVEASVEGLLREPGLGHEAGFRGSCTERVISLASFGKSDLVF